MKAFKTVDWILQLALIVSGLIVAVFRWKIDVADVIFFGYLSVGGWQMISVFVHFFFPATIKIKMRKFYLILLVLTLITGIIFQLTGENNILNFLLGLLFWSPVLALIYLITCIMETKKMKAIIS